MEDMECNITADQITNVHTRLPNDQGIYLQSIYNNKVNRKKLLIFIAKKRKEALSYMSKHKDKAYAPCLATKASAYIKTSLTKHNRTEQVPQVCHSSTPKITISNPESTCIS